MWSMWNAPSDLDYYGQDGCHDEEPDEEQEEELEPPEYLFEDQETGPEPPAEEQGEQQWQTEFCDLTPTHQSR